MTELDPFTDPFANPADELGASTVRDVDWYRRGVAALAEAGDTEELCFVYEKLRQYVTDLRLVVSEAEAAIAGLIDGPTVVDGVRYRLVPDRQKQWDAAGLLRQIVADHADRIDALPAVLLSVLPSTVGFRVGKPGEDGVRALGMNPDDWSDSVVRGMRLEAKPVDQ